MLFSKVIRTILAILLTTSFVFSNSNVSINNLSPKSEVPLSPEEEILGPIYASTNRLDPKSVNKDIQPAEKNDILNLLTSFSKEEKERLKNIALEYLKQGKVAPAILAGGAASRMPMDQLPPELKDAVESGEISAEIATKALVPVAKVNNKWLTLIDLFFMGAKKLGDINNAHIPTILTAGANNEKAIKDYVKSTSYGKALDSMLKYTGFPGYRMHPKESDVIANKGKIEKYVKENYPELSKNEVSKKIENIYKRSLNYAKTNAGDIVEIEKKDGEDKGKKFKIMAPRGHGGLFHNLFFTGVITEIVKAGIEIIYFRNIDNTGASFDDNFLLELGYMIDKNYDFLLEVSKRPDGQSGGTITKKVDDKGNTLKIQNNEDSTLGARKDEFNGAYYINNASGLCNLDFIFKIYGTSKEEILEISKIKNPEERKARLDFIGNTGFTRFPITPVIKVIKDCNGEELLGLQCETMMWEATGIDVDTKVGAIGVGSIADLLEFGQKRYNTDDILKISELLMKDRNVPEVKNMLDYVRFAPMKDWGNFDESKGLSRTIAKHRAESLQPSSIENQITELFKNSNLSNEEIIKNQDLLINYLKGGIIKNSDLALNLIELLMYNNDDFPTLLKQLISVHDNNKLLEGQESLKKGKIKFGTSGVRGVIGKTFNDDLIKRTVQGISEYLNTLPKEDIENGEVLISYDPRQNNKENVLLTASIVASNGLKVKIIKEDATPTPVAGYLAKSAQGKVIGVINFTASHNPGTDNGIKFSPAHGGAADASITDAITSFANDAKIVNVGSYNTLKEEKLINEMPAKEAVNIYVNDYIIPQMKKIGAWKDIVNYIKSNKDFELVIDAMQGTSGIYVEALYKAMEKDVGRKFYKVLHVDNDDPTFSKVGGAPNPTLEGSITKLVEETKKGKKILGIGADGDADRFGHVDFGGISINTDVMMALLTYFLNKEVGLKGDVGKTVATSNFINAVADHLNLKVHETAVGFKYMVDLAENQGVDFLIAGEESAHVGVKNFMESWDDGMVMGLMGLWMVAKTNKSISEYKEHVEKKIGKQFFKKTVTVRGEDDSFKDGINKIISETKNEIDSGINKLQTKVVLKLAEKYNQKPKDMINLDGIKVVFESGDWVLLRPSGTEPAVKVYAEVTDENKLQELIEVGKDVAGLNQKASSKPSTKDTKVDKQKEEQDKTKNQVKEIQAKTKEIVDLIIKRKMTDEMKPDKQSSEKVARGV